MQLLDIDGRSLRLLLAVFDEGSIARAAPRLNLSPSAVSHALDRLRISLDDPLFVRSGRGIVPTSHMQDIAQDAREIVERLEALKVRRAFMPSDAVGEFTIAANDYQRDLLLPTLFRRIRSSMPGLAVRIVSSGFENADLLRSGRCDLMISPDPPDGTEFMRKRLLSDRFACFFDSTVTTAPLDLEDYVSRPHAKVVFSANEQSTIDRLLADTGRARRVALAVSNFSGLAMLLPGTEVIATLPSRMAMATLRHLAIAPCPLPAIGLDLYLGWHRRDHDRPLNRYMRGLIREEASRIASSN